MSKLPKQTGHYWAKWRIKDEGTAEEDEPPLDEWEVVQVFQNCIDPRDPEFLSVLVPGVERAQSIENFVWGEGPLKAPASPPKLRVVPA